MFVLLNRAEDEKVNIHSVDKWIKEERDDGFTPDEAMQVLKWSNFYGNIKTAVKEINKCETKEERLAFKEFVLSAVDRRVTSGESLAMLRALAVEGGYEEEFDKINDNAKVYGELDCGLKTAVISKPSEIVRDYSEYDYIIFDCNVTIQDVFKIDVMPKSVCFACNMSVDVGYMNSWKDGDRLVLLNASSFEGCFELPKNVYFGDCKKVSLANCDLSKVEKMYFPKGCEVAFADRGYPERYSSTKLPKNLDLRNLDEVDFRGVDLDNVENILFGKKSKVIFGPRRYCMEIGAKNLSGVLDLSEVDEVNLSNCDLSKVTEIKFKEGAKVELDHATNLPENIDFSKVGELSLFKTDLSQVKQLKFGKNCKLNMVGCDLSSINEVIFEEGAQAYLESITGINVGIDFSKCSKVTLVCIEMPEHKMDLSANGEVMFKVCEMNNANIKFGNDTDVTMFRCKNISDGVDFSCLKSVSLEGCKNNKASKYVFAKGSNVNLYFSSLPESIDASEVGELSIRGDYDEVKDIKYPAEGVLSLDFLQMPEKIDLSRYDKVTLKRVDCSNNNEIIFKDGACVNLSGSGGFHGVVDFSNLACIDLTNTNLSGATKVKFGEGEVILGKEVKLPKNIDVSKVRVLKVDKFNLEVFDELDLSNIEKIVVNKEISAPKKIRLSKNNEYVCEALGGKNTIFKICKDGDFKFGADTVVPCRLDLSEHDEVDFGNADLSNLQSCVFKKGASVKLDNVSKYPEILDLSMCGDVNLSAENMSKMNTIIFKNEAQRDKVMANMKFNNILEKMRFKRKCKYYTEVNTQTNKNRSNEPCL